MPKTIAIIGTGPAGVRVAQTLRERRFEGKIVMFSAEDAPPYCPAALGEYLASGNEELLFWQGRDFFGTYGIEAHTAEKILRVEPESRVLHTEKGKSVAFDELVIASGSSLFIPPTVEGRDRKDILNFKSLSGATKIREMARGGLKDATILGGGFIGVEIALCLAKIGIRPTILNRRGWIMPRLLDKETSGYVLEDLRKKGVEVLLNTEGKRFYGDEKTEGLLTVDGRKLASDMFIVATGVKPNMDFVFESGIENDGTAILVNSRLQTNYPWIYACGDVSRTTDFISGEKVVHALHTAAVSQAGTVALNIMGLNADHEPQISMNSLKELSFKLIVVGNLEGWELRYRKGGVLRKVFLNDTRQINGFVLLGDISNAGYLLSLLKNRTKIDRTTEKIAFPSYTRALLTTRYV